MNQQDMTDKDRMIKKIWGISMKCCSLLCHQRSDRSFFIGTYQFPLCARCTGVTIGFIAALLCLIFGFQLSIIVSISLILVMFADWLLQYLKIKTSTNMRRLITGVLGGYGLSMFTYSFVTFLHDKVVQ